MSKHSSGPWKTRWVQGACLIEDPKGFLVAAAPQRDNAYLIAAAPELLSALERALESHENLGTRRGWAKAAKEAIEKARMEEEA